MALGASPVVRPLPLGTRTIEPTPVVLVLLPSTLRPDQLRGEHPTTDVGRHEMAPDYPIERFDPLLRDLITWDLVVKTRTSGQWLLSDSAEQRLDELVEWSSPVDSEQMVYFDHHCADCPGHIRTRLHGGLYLCDRCRELRATPLVDNRGSGAAETGKHRRIGTMVTFAVFLVLGIVGTAAVIAVTRQPSSSTSLGNTGTGVGVVSDPSQLSCHPSGIGVDHVCRLMFQDLHRGSRAGYRVCFSSPAPDAILGTTGRCSITNSYGQADGVFIAERAGTATVTATETSAASVAEGTVKLTITVSTASGSARR